MDDPLLRYVAYLEGFDRAALEKLEDRVTVDVRFSDPFNDTVGIDAMRAVFSDMLEHVHGLQFKVDTYGWCKHPPAASRAMLAWQLSGCLPAFGDRPWSVEGMRLLEFDDSGIVSVRRDHWDAASGLYTELPVIGRLLSWMRRRFATRVELQGP